MGEIVSGWSDDDHVYLVERDGDRVGARRLPARWSAFFRGMDDKDRAALARTRDVIRVELDAHGYTRADFRNRHARRESLQRIEQAIKLRRMDVFHEEDATKLYDGAILEGDVGPLRRLLSDVPQLQIGTPRPVYLDLEVDSRQRFDDMKAGKARILAWALYTLDGSEARRAGSAVLADDTDAAERDLLRQLFEALGAFDLVLSWNGDEFDFPVLEMRTQRLRVKLDNGRLPIWNRWCWLDHMETFKKYNQAHDSGEERSSFALNAIAQHIVGEGKTDFDSAKTWEEWAAGGERRARLLSYCEQDTALMARIEAKTGFVALHVAVCQVTRCFPDSASLGAAQQGDGFLLALGGQRGYRFPTKKSWEEMGEVDAFAGAYVMTPKRVGVLDDVHVCDFAGLYPSIIRSWNMSIDTYLSPARARAANGTIPMARLPLQRDVHFRTDRRGIFPEALDHIVAERAKYTKRADDAEPGSEEWHRFKRLSSAYKIIANSFYGIIGSPFTRFFDREIAEGVTQAGQWLIKHVAATVEATGVLEAIYGDTDSVFAQSREHAAARDPERVAREIEVFERVVSTLNEQWPEVLRRMGCTESRIKLDFEKSFRRLVLVSAKRYAARYARWKGKPAPADMKPEVKGLEYKRGDQLRLAREMQREAIDMLLDVEGTFPTPATFREFIDRWRRRVLEEPLELDDIVLSQSVKNLGDYATRYTSAKCTNKVQAPGTTTKKGLKSCGYDFGSTQYDEEVSGKCPRCGAERKIAAQPVHVRVAKILVERGLQVTEGTRIEYLIVGRPEDEEDDGKMVAVPAHDAGAMERIDRDYYWDSRILPPTARLLEAVWAHEKWKETAASRRRAAEALQKAIDAEARRRDPNRALEGLPLFGHDPGPPPAPRPRPAPSTSPEPAPAPEAPAAAPTPATPPAPAKKPRKPRAPRPPPPPDPPLLVVAHVPDLPKEAAEAKLGRVLEAIRAAVVAYPGRAPVTIRVTDRRTGNHVDQDGGMVARSDRARYALERVVGVGNVMDLVVEVREEQGHGAGEAQEGPGG